MHNYVNYMFNEKNFESAHGMCETYIYLHFKSYSISYIVYRIWNDIVVTNKRIFVYAYNVHTSLLLLLDLNTIGQDSND